MKQREAETDRWTEQTEMGEEHGTEIDRDRETDRQKSMAEEKKTQGPPRQNE